MKESDQEMTPACVLDKVREFSPIDLDPCGAQESLVKARREFRIDQGDDGLELDWSVRDGICFVNPPYSRPALCKWVDKIFREAKNGVEIIALLPSNTDVMWFQTCVCAADVICFWRGRIKFINPNRTKLSPAFFPSVLAYYGRQKLAFGKAFEHCGWIVRPKTKSGNNSQNESL